VVAPFLLKEIEMEQKKFDAVVNSRFEYCKEILGVKGSVYASKKNRLKNFYDGASLNECTPKQYAFMLMTKHLVALKDYIREDRKMEEDFIDEKVSDIINYAVLIEALNEEEEN
jgi:hypothetical protein